MFWYVFIKHLPQRHIKCGVFPFGRYISNFFFWISATWQISKMDSIRDILLGYKHGVHNIETNVGWSGIEGWQDGTNSFLQGILTEFGFFALKSLFNQIFSEAW